MPEFNVENGKNKAAACALLIDWVLQVEAHAWEKYRTNKTNDDLSKKLKNYSTIQPVNDAV